MTPADERWRPVVGYEGHYEVSDHGRVRSLDRVLPNRLGHLKPHRGRLIAGKRSPADGRRLVGLGLDGSKTYRTVYALVLEAFVGPRPTGAYGCHNDGDAANDWLDNLRWDTPSGNSFDTVAHGRHHQVVKTHCPLGHGLAQPNLVASRAKRGQRNCLACARARSGAAYARRTSRPFDLKAEADEHYARITTPGGRRMQ